MGRSVSTPSDASETVYTTFDGDEFDWTDMVDDLRMCLSARYRSLESADGWIGREDRVIAENALVWITISEYCGCVAVCIVPKDGDVYCDNRDLLADRWSRQIAGGFRQIVHSVFGETMVRLGCMSNGESVYRREG